MAMLIRWTVVTWSVVQLSSRKKDQASGEKRQEHYDWERFLFCWFICLFVWLVFVCLFVFCYRHILLLLFLYNLFYLASHQGQSVMVRQLTDDDMPSSVCLPRHCLHTCRNHRSILPRRCWILHLQYWRDYQCLTAKTTSSLVWSRGYRYLCMMWPCQRWRRQWQRWWRWKGRGR